MLRPLDGDGELGGGEEALLPQENHKPIEQRLQAVQLRVRQLWRLLRTRQGCVSAGRSARSRVMEDLGEEDVWFDADDLQDEDGDLRLRCADRYYQCWCHHDQSESNR